MAFDDRLLFLLLGVGIGFVFGYLTRLLQGVRDIKKELDEVKEELNEVDSIVKENLGDHHYSGTHVGTDEEPISRQNEKGFMTYRWGANIAVLLMVVLTAWAAFVSQKASNDVKHSQERIEQIVSCNRATTADVIESLNGRSTYSVNMAQANIDLQRAQSDFFTLLAHKPPYSEERRTRAFLAYLDSLTAFLELAEKNKGNLATNDFPTIDDFEDCLND